MPTPSQTFIAPPSRLKRLCSRGADSRRSKGPNRGYNGSNRLLYTSRSGRAGFLYQTGGLTPDPPPPLASSRTWMDPKGRQRKMTTFLLSLLSRLTLRPDQGFGAYLRFFREGFA